MITCLFINAHLAAGGMRGDGSSRSSQLPLPSLRRLPSFSRAISTVSQVTYLFFVCLSVLSSIHPSTKLPFLSSLYLH